MTPIVQCVPNLSEGRDLAKIHAITEPLKDQPGFKLISLEPDQDYHRTVITLIGDPMAMQKPLLAFFKKAAELIDMNTHQGEHPRMGAVDVVPFIPIQGITIEDCIDHAETLAKTVAETLDIPVYLYADAAKEPSRTRLPAIRKGEFEGMKDKIKTSDWKPDFGPAAIHPTFGVVAIGARIPLLAYNIDLATDDMKIAKAIARAIRQSTGGFQYVQAGPAFLEDKGHVQVTMNILDFKKNPVYRIFETVKMEAARYQVDVTASEVVGLFPKAALTDSLKYYHGVTGQPFDKDMTLDDVVDASIRYLKLRDFDRLKIIEANLS
ncbi:MAG: glutamate formimidoyltransferase [Acholeplasmataceae bacterium]|nr:MAG: glutamate formimidoyltransferase [Acholeplasmataceae bacterium]